MTTKVTDEKMFRVWSKEYEEYDEDLNDFFMSPNGELFFIDYSGKLHRADPAKYEIEIVCVYAGEAI